MAEVQPGMKICDRCDTYRATPQTIERRTPSENGSLLLSTVTVDLCDRCGNIADKAIERAVKPK